ncbi:hypothetical protein LZD49_35220, partial [Dyadobacter sp. CY261]|uniref:hypothetical protein n=1 Tax=Dyadobacter sp. CY261 TaxID=2907203 RepID=UPI001F2C4358
MKRIIFLWLLFASFIAHAQTIPDVNTRPPKLPGFQVSKLSPFSFSFQVKPGYVIEGPVVAEVYRDALRLIDSTAIDVEVHSNYVTVSFTQQQIASLPMLSQCYISWGNPRIRRLVTDLKPGTGGGTPTLGKISLDIIEVQIAGDTYNSWLSAQYADSSKIDAQIAADTAIVKASAATQMATAALIAKDTAVSARTAAITARNTAITAKDTA